MVGGERNDKDEVCIRSIMTKDRDRTSTPASMKSTNFNIGIQYPICAIEINPYQLAKVPFMTP